MTNPEFKLEFNTYYNNVTSNQAPGYNDFEISEFLTLAEEQIVAELYENTYSGFEKTENVRKSLDALLGERTITLVLDNTNLFDTKAYGGTLSIQSNKQDTHPDEVMFIVMEWAQIGVKSKDEDTNEDIWSKERTVEVIPIKYDDFLRTYKNPFRGVSKNRVIRIDTNNDNVKLHADKNWDIKEYRIEYLKKPKPIIIGDDSFEGLTINGYDAGTDVPCELDSILHRPILLRAVQLAKAAWQSK